MCNCKFADWSSTQTLSHLVPRLFLEFGTRSRFDHQQFATPSIDVRTNEPARPMYWVQGIASMFACVLILTLSCISDDMCTYTDAHTGTHTHMCLQTCANRCAHVFQTHIQLHMCINTCQQGMHIHIHASVASHNTTLPSWDT